MSSTIKLMKRNLQALMFLLLTASLGLSQEAAPTPTPATPTPTPAAAAKPAAVPAPTQAAPVDDLKAVLAQMDKASGFKSAEADFEWETYTRVVNEREKQAGHIFFRRTSKNNVDASVQVITPHAKQAVIKEGKVSMYIPETNQTTVREIGSNRADVESLMNLGFGGRGQDLLKDYDVKMDGWEKVDGIQTAKLELVPKGDHLKQFFSKVILWVDPKRDVPLKQQRLQSSGDYQLTHYTNIELNGKISDDVFRLKTASKK